MMLIDGVEMLDVREAAVMLGVDWRRGAAAAGQ